MSTESSTKIVRPLRRGQITIPAEFRRSLHIDEDSLLEITLLDGKIEITPVVTTSADQSWLRELHTMFLSVREQALGLDEAEIDATIDETISEVRLQQ